MGLDLSELHKTVIKEFWNCRQQSTLSLIEVDMSKSVKVGGIHHQIFVDLGKRWRMKPDDMVEELIQKTYANKTKRK